MRKDIRNRARDPAATLPAHRTQPPHPAEDALELVRSCPFRPGNVSELEAIMKALEKTPHKTAAAKLLGMSFRGLRYRIKKLGIE